MSKLSRLRISGFNSLPASVRILIRPMVIVAIGLHALLLFYPFSKEQKPKPQPTDKKSEPVKLTQLSKSTPAQNRPKRQLPKANNRPKSPITAPKKPQAPPGKAGAQSADILADFPHYPNAQPNCYGKTGDICRFTNDSISAVVSHFEKALPAKKYKADLDTNEADVKIYRVSKGNQSFYLSILTDSPITVYFVTSDKINKATLAKIKSGAVAQIPPELPAFLDAVSPPPSSGGATLDATPIDFGPNADSFFQSDPDNPSNQVTLPGIYSARITEGKGEADIIAEAKTKFSVTPVGSYGGGQLYEIKKNSFTGYLSVIKGTTGTIAVVWTQKP